MSSWTKRNKGANSAKEAKRRSKKLQRTPRWTETYKIIKFYKERPEGYHVDHIIPLQGKYVSGLHVLDNLQYLIAKDNLRKSNKYSDYLKMEIIL